jgi:hypothetical protein
MITGMSPAFFLFFLMVAFLTGVIMVLICISLRIREIENFFHVLFAIYVLSFRKGLFSTFSYFQNWIFLVYRF